MLEQTLELALVRQAGDRRALTQCGNGQMHATADDAIELAHNGLQLARRQLVRGPKQAIAEPALSSRSTSAKVSLQLVRVRKSCAKSSQATRSLELIDVIAAAAALAKPFETLWPEDGMQVETEDSFAAPAPLGDPVDDGSQARRRLVGLEKKGDI